MLDSVKKLFYRFLKTYHPFNYSQITDHLYIAAWPVGENYTEIVDLGVRLVINMDWVPPDPKLSESPLRVLTLLRANLPVTPDAHGKDLDWGQGRRRDDCKKR